MSVEAITYRCDWPGCEAVVTVGSGSCDLDDANWETRNVANNVARWHACPVHRFHTTREFNRAIRKAESDATKEGRPI